MIRRHLSPEEIRAGQQVTDQIEEFVGKATLAQVSNHSPNCMLGAGIARRSAEILEIASLSGDLVVKESNGGLTIKTREHSKLLHGRVSTQSHSIDAPHIEISTNVQGRRQMCLGGVGDASSRHDILLSPGVIGVRILEDGTTRVERSPVVDIPMTDKEILLQVRSELTDSKVAWMFSKSGK